MSRRGCLPVELCLQRQAMSWICPGTDKWCVSSPYPGSPKSFRNGGWAGCWECRRSQQMCCTAGCGALEARDGHPDTAPAPSPVPTCPKSVRICFGSVFIVVCQHLGITICNILQYAPYAAERLPLSVLLCFHLITMEGIFFVFWYH